MLGRGFVARLRRRALEERGAALMLAVVTLGTLATTSTTVLYFTSQAEWQSGHGRAQDSAYRCAESGLGQALSVVQNKSANPLDETILPPSSGAGNAYTCTGGGTGQYWGDFDGSSVWTLKATASVANPGGANLKAPTRTVGATVTVSEPSGDSYAYTDNAWMYLFSTAPPTTGCDQTYTTSVQSSIYVTGNLCVSGSGRIWNYSSSTPINVITHGWTWSAAAANYLGSSANNGRINFGPATGASGGCKSGGTAPPGAPTSTRTPCVSGLDNTYYTARTNTTLDPPQPNWADWYTFAQPGPRINCSASNSSTPSSNWPTFESASNFVRDNSRAAAGYVNLTPTYSYDCRTSRGRLKWDNATNALTVSGTVFIDGDARIARASATTITYSGWGSLYVEGTFYMGNVTMNPSYLNWGGVRWALGLLVVASNGNNGACAGSATNGVASGVGTSISATTFGGWLYSTCDIQTDATTVTKGGMIGRKLILGNSVNSGTNWFTWYAQPSGAPGESPTITASPPSNFSG
jgi:hypothetical protein